MQTRITFVLALMAAASLQGAGLRIATFRADITPPKGSPLIPLMPATGVHDPLWAKGVVIEDGKNRYVMCALDWCGVGGRSHKLFREKAAAAAGTTPDRTAIQTVHQHAAPFVFGDAFDLMQKYGVPVAVPFTDRAMEEITDRVAAAIRKAVTELAPFDSIGVSEARVDRVASERRLLGPDGKIITRWSDSADDAAMAAAPEGAIDPLVKTVSFGRGGKPIVRMHFYATHPQTRCCDGFVSSDIVGMARERLEREEGVSEVYFTGCAGNITMGKYNDKTPAKRDELAQRLYEGLKASSARTKWSPAKNVRWKSAQVVLPKGTQGKAIAAEIQKMKDTRDDAERYELARDLVFAQRKEPMDAMALTIGNVNAMFLPGEPFVDFQKFAQSLQNGRFIAVAAYGDQATGYICTDAAYREGGYEPSASHTAPGAEAVLRQALEALAKD